jgi:hypothetical protein
MKIGHRLERCWGIESAANNMIHSKGVEPDAHDILNDSEDPLVQRDVLAQLLEEQVGPLRKLSGSRDDVITPRMRENTRSAGIQGV